MFARRSKLFGLRCLLQDLILTVLAFPLAFFLRAWVLPQFGILGPIYPLLTYWPLLLGIVSFWSASGWALGLYRHVDPRKKAQLVRDALGLVTLNSVAIFAGLYLAHGEYVSRSLVLAFWLVDGALVICGRLFVLPADLWLRNHMDRYRYFLIVGTGGPAREVARFLEQGGSLGDRLIGFAYTGAEPPDDLRGVYRMLPVDALPDLLETQPVDEVIFVVSREELGQLEPIMLRCEQEGVQTRVHLDFLPLDVTRVYLEHLRDIPLLTFANAPDNEILLALKRLVDIFLAAVLLPLASPLFALIAVLIKWNSPGPVVYRQTRCGIGGRHFVLYKFRSMVADAEARRAALETHNDAEGPVFKMTDDPRITRVGRWLRRFSLDELPQLWNILRGDMSFVGPRPPLAAEVARYEKWQRRRLRMRPGLTCLWAIEGRSHIKFDRWMELDLAYIDNWSLWLDAKIFLKTIPCVLRGNGAF